VIAVIFYFDRKRIRTSFLALCWGYYIIPFLVFIYIAISTGIISEANSGEPCYLASKIWLLADCLVFAFLIPEFFYLYWTMNVKNLKDYVMNKVADGIASRQNRSLAQIVKNLKDSLKKSIN